MKKIALVALLSAVVSAPAFADNMGNFYVAGDLGAASLNNSNPGGTGFPNPGVVRIAGGYHFSPMLAVEAGYAMLGDSTLTIGASSYTTKNSAFQVAAIASYSVAPSLDVFGKLGMSMNSNTISAPTYNTSNSTTGLMYGVGAQYNLSKQLGIRAQYENLGNFKYSNGVTKVSWNVGTTLFSAGAVYNF